MDQLGRASDAMGEAEGQLGEGNADDAVDSQGRALEALRRGAQNLAQSMQQQGGRAITAAHEPWRRASMTRNYPAKATRSCACASSLVLGFAGNCNTVASWPSHKNVRRSICPSGSSSASWCICGCSRLIWRKIAV